MVLTTFFWSHDWKIQLKTGKKHDIKLSKSWQSKMLSLMENKSRWNHSSTVNHQRVEWVGLKKSKTWWRNTWIPYEWKKEQKKYLTFWSGDLNPRFLVIVPPMIWIFMESEEREIKSKQASKRYRTLVVFSYYIWL